MARVAALGGTAGALLGVGLDRLLGGGAVLWAAALAFAAGGSSPSASPIPAGPGRPRPWKPGRPPVGERSRPETWRRVVHSPRDLGRDPAGPDGPADGAAGPAAGAGAAGQDGQRERAGGRGVQLFLLAFELRRQGVGTAGLGLLLAAVGVGGVVGAFLLPRAARLVREDGLLAGGLLLCGTTAGLLAGRVGVAAAAAGGLAMGAGIAAARLGFESLVQREVPPPARGTAITRAETTFQLAWVAGAVLPVALPLPTTPALFAAAVVCLVAATTYTVGLLRLRRRRALTLLRRLVGDALEQPAQPGVELAVGGGAGQLAGQRPHPGEAVPGQAGEGGLGPAGAGVGVALDPRRLEGGEPEGVDQQDPERLDRPLALEAAPPQQLEADLAEPGRVRPQPRAAEEHGHQPGVGQQQPAGGVHHPDQASGLIRPLGAWVLREACRQAAAWQRSSPPREQAADPQHQPVRPPAPVPRGGRRRRPGPGARAACPRRRWSWR